MQPFDNLFLRKEIAYNFLLAPVRHGKTNPRFYLLMHFRKLRLKLTNCHGLHTGKQTCFLSRRPGAFVILNFSRFVMDQ